MNITLLVVAMNEIEGMRAIMPQVDGTAEYARECGYVVHVQKEPGIRQGYNEVLPLIEGDVVITFSPDGNSIPSLIPELIRKMHEGYDMVIASRYLGDAKSEDDDIVTRFGNWLFTNTVNTLFRSNYTDVMVIYRAYRVGLIEELGLTDDAAYSWIEGVLRTRISWEPLLSVRAAKRKVRFCEIPGSEPARIGGERKLQVVKWGLAYMYQVMHERFTT